MGSRRSPVVTLRDKQMLAVLAQARCLSTEQLRRLFFPHQRQGRGSAVERRLRALAAMKPALIEPHRWTNESGRHTVWALAPYGAELAERELDVELSHVDLNVSLDYIEHHILLSELFVGLLELPLKAKPAPPATLSARERQRALPSLYARAHHPSFEWCVRGDLAQPWKQPDGGQLRARLIRPDALLELPKLRQRIFVEAERGTHSVAATSGRKPGATSAKMDNYSAFCDGLATLQPRRTWYQQKHPDGFAPRVLFLVASERRRASVDAAIAAHAKKGPTSCVFQAATTSEAVSALARLLGVEATADVKPAASREALSSLTLSTQDYGAFREFYESVLTHFRGLRAKAAERKETKPPYPHRTDEVHRLLVRLSDAAA